MYVISFSFPPLRLYGLLPSQLTYPYDQDSQIFLSVDFIALVIQAAGGGIASGSEPKLGAHIMLVGIVVQFGMSLASDPINTQLHFSLSLTPFPLPSRNYHLLYPRR